MSQQIDLNDTVSTPLADALRLLGPGNLNAYFQHHSKTFSFAARFFNRDQRWVVKRVYAFCRFTDDLVDSNDDMDNEEALFVINQWEKVVRNVYNGANSNISWLDELLHTSRSRGVKLEWITDLIAGVRFDTGFVRFDSREELDRYCYQVASTVGLWVAALCNPNATELESEAVELGKAMQMTNIIRDVGEDLDRNRVYVPRFLLDKHGIGHDELQTMRSSGRIDERYALLIREMIAIADQHYEAAWSGILRLPFRMGIAIAVASSTYRGIHRAVKSNSYDSLHHRAYTRPWQKGILAAKAIVRYLAGRMGLRSRFRPGDVGRTIQQF